MSESVRIGCISELQAKGQLTGKVGSRPVCVFWSEGKAYAVEDRCPHMGFPLHRGTVADGLLTCHWHHARFDLRSGGTLDPFADDVRAYPVRVDGDEVSVLVEGSGEAGAYHLRRIEEGLEEGLSLVSAKAVLGCFETMGEAAATKAVLLAGLAFGTRYRAGGWGAGLTVLTAMANVAPLLDAQDRPLALVHGLVFVSRDTLGNPARFALEPLDSPGDPERFGSWYRRFVGTRSGDAAERALASAIRAGLPAERVAAAMGAAHTDHVFIDGGHTIDFTNKAFEVLDHVGWDQAGSVLTTLAHQAAGASRSEETSSWRHPIDLAALVERAESRLPELLRCPVERSFSGDRDVESLAWSILGDDPDVVIASMDQALARGATPEELARAVAYAAALRMTRFHVQNDHRDWDVVHHGFTSANAIHQLVIRAGAPELVRGIYQGALKVYLDRFLNVPAARLPHVVASAGQGLGRREAEALLQECWDREGMVDEAGAAVYSWMRCGGRRAEVLATLGKALLAEDAEFHWFQTFEAAARQSAAWPEGSEQQALILAGTARFLAAHTPSRRELAQVVKIATRLRRGDPLYEFADEL